MSRSMHSCSGKYWVGQAVAWSAFAIAVAVAIDPEAPQAQPVVDVTAKPRTGLVSVNIHTMDLAVLDDAAYGDQEPAAQPVR